MSTDYPIIMGGLWYLKILIWTMVCTKTINYRLSLFFNLSFIANKWGTKNKKSIFFNFCQIFAFFEDFSRFHNVIRSFHFEKWQNFGKKLRKAWYRIFFQPYSRSLHSVQECPKKTAHCAKLHCARPLFYTKWSKNISNLHYSKDPTNKSTLCKALFLYIVI